MIKKFLIIMFVVFSIFSCGKKGDPVYKDESRNTKLTSTQTSTIS